MMTTTRKARPRETRPSRVLPRSTRPLTMDPPGILVWECCTCGEQYRGIQTIFGRALSAVLRQHLGGDIGGMPCSDRGLPCTHPDCPECEGSCERARLPKCPGTEVYVRPASGRDGWGKPGTGERIRVLPDASLETLPAWLVREAVILVEAEQAGK